MSDRMIPLAAMEALMKKAGATRISENSKKALKQILEEHGIKLTANALELAKHAKRKTIRAKDLELARR